MTHQERIDYAIALNESMPDYHLPKNTASRKRRDYNGGSQIGQHTRGRKIGKCGGQP